MEVRLYLARHAHATDDAPSDEARPLSAKGHKQMKRLVAGFKGKELLSVDAIWQSGLVRARETASALKDGLDLVAPMSEKRGLAPYDDPAEIAEQLNALDHSCLVAGHEPNLSYLSSILLADSREFTRIVFPKASILCLSRMIAGSQSTPWQIEWHISHHFFK